MWVKRLTLGFGKLVDLGYCKPSDQYLGGFKLLISTFM
jgi:hypothetical protein